MGSTLGCHRSIPRDPSDLSHNRKFSAACNFSNILVNQERLNINTATEEELMTLPGVTRAVARSIVEYREYIGGFKKVEDLALVSGVGATKLEQVKFEICVSSKGNSAQHSPSSLRRDLLAEQQPHHLTTTVPLTPRVNINTATLAQLMSVRGLSEKMALSIVDYRREHGPFRSVEDLVRMDGINAAFLDRIRHQVFAERSRPPSTHTNGGLTFTAKPHPSPTSLSLQSEDLDLPPGGPTQIISMRPSVEAFGGMRDGRPVFRLATWNLQGCSVEKANNPGVREVVCMTLLENSSCWGIKEKMQRLRRLRWNPIGLQKYRCCIQDLKLCICLIAKPGLGTHFAKFSMSFHVLFLNLTGPQSWVKLRGRVRRVASPKPLKLSQPQKASVPFLFLFLKGWGGSQICGANSEDVKASLLGPNCKFETLGSTPRWSSGLQSQGILGHFQTERWSARRLLWLCKRRWGERVKGGLGVCRKDRS